MTLLTETGSSPPGRQHSDKELHERTNAELVSQAVEDPARGLALLHDRYSRSLNRLVYRLLGPDTDHDDIVQQIFLQIIQSIGKVRTPDRLDYWVRSIAINIVRSELRSRSVRRTFLGWYRRDDVGDLNNDVESSSFLARSRAVLERMPAEERMVFLLYYLEEATLPEIAELHGFSAMTAKRRLSKARSRFKKYMNWEPDSNSLRPREEDQ